MGVSKKNLTLLAGATNTLVIRWENADRLLYKQVSAVVSQAPLRLTVPSHGIPDGWAVALIGVTGADLNSEMVPPRSVDMRETLVVDANTIEINDLVVSGTVGVVNAKIVMYEPRTLALHTARMQVRPNVNASATLLTLVSPTEIVIDEVNFKTTVTIPPLSTQGATWVNGVYDVEFVSSTGEVFRVVQGDVVLEKEVTR